MRWRNTPSAVGIKHAHYWDLNFKKEQFTFIISIQRVWFKKKKKLDKQMWNESHSSPLLLVEHSQLARSCSHVSSPDTAELVSPPPSALSRPCERANTPGHLQTHACFSYSSWGDFRKLKHRNQKCSRSGFLLQSIMASAMWRLKCHDRGHLISGCTIHKS